MTGTVGTGTFITFEGGEGSGKSTQIARLASSLRKSGREVVVTRAPGGTSLGEQVREIVLHSDDDGLAPRAETLLFLADMAHLTDSVIRPALDRGAIVLCDRYFDSTIAYQGYARGHGAEAVSSIARWATGGLVPDVTILLDVPVEIGLSRKSDDEWNRMESAGVEFHERVRGAMKELCARSPERFRVVDARNDSDTVFRDLVSSLGENLWGCAPLSLSVR